VKTSPRACFFVGNYRPESFGIGRYVPYYVDAVADAGWTAEVFAPYPFYPAWKLDQSLPRVSTESAGRVRVVRYAPFVPHEPTAWPRMAHELSLGWHAIRALTFEAGSPDLFIAASPPLLGSAVTVWHAQRHRRPSLLLAYDLVADLTGDAFGLLAGAPGRALRAIEATMYARASHVIGLSREMAERITTLSGRTTPVSVLHIWADDGLFVLDRDQAAARFRREQGLSPETSLIGFAGNFGRKQQLPIVAGAASLLPGDVRTIFVGNGPHRMDLERAAAARPDRLRVLPPQSEDGLHAFLSACHASIVVAWTRHGGSLFPSKVANILAAGCPIVAIAPRDCELSQLIESERLGIVCASLEPRDLCAALARSAELGRSPAQRLRCRQYAERHLRRDGVTASFVRQAEGLLSQAPDQP
jgi:putative colanic acid biosynthesis glycosyltransferase WcaI